MRLLGDLRSLLAANADPSLDLWDAICLLLVGEDEEELVQGYIPYLETHFRKTGIWGQRRNWAGDMDGSPLTYFVNHMAIGDRDKGADVYSFFPAHLDHLVVYDHNVPTQYDADFFEKVTCKCVLWRALNSMPPSCLKTEVLMIANGCYRSNRTEAEFLPLTRHFYKTPPKVFFVEVDFLAAVSGASALCKRIAEDLDIRKDVVMCRTITEWFAKAGPLVGKPSAYKWDWQSERQRNGLRIDENQFEVSKDFSHMDLSIAFYEWCQKQAF